MGRSGPYGPVDLIIVGGESPYSLRQRREFWAVAAFGGHEIPDATSGDGSHHFKEAIRISGVPEQASKNRRGPALS